MTEHTEGKKLEEVVVEKTGALSTSDTVEVAGARMRSLDANAWPVVEGRKLVGTIDHPHPDRQAGGRGHDPTTTTVSDMMTRQMIFCYEDTGAEEAQRIMNERNINHLPVVDREMKLVGILSRAEVLGQVAPPAAPPSTTAGEASSDSTQRKAPM